MLKRNFIVFLCFLVCLMSVKNADDGVEISEEAEETRQEPKEKEPNKLKPENESSFSRFKRNTESILKSYMEKLKNVNLFFIFKTKVFEIT